MSVFEVGREKKKAELLSLGRLERLKIEEKEKKAEDLFSYKVETFRDMLKLLGAEDANLLVGLDYEFEGYILSMQDTWVSPDSESVYIKLSVRPSGLPDPETIPFEFDRFRHANPLQAELCGGVIVNLEKVELSVGDRVLRCDQAVADYREKLALYTRFSAVTEDELIQELATGFKEDFSTVLDLTDMEIRTIRRIIDKYYKHMKRRAGGRE